MAVVDNLQDKNGVTYDIAAKQFSGTRTITLTGDITGSVTDDFSDSVSISTGIADNAVDTSTIADGAVTTSKVADESVTSEKLSTELQTSIGKSHSHDNKNKLDNYSNAGNSSTPVYIAADGTPTACTAADIKAGKDASGNIITSTYATKSEMESKNFVKCITITSGDLNNLSPLGSFENGWWCYSDADAPNITNAPESNSAAYINEIKWSSTGKKQFAWIRDTSAYHYERTMMSGSWPQSWIKVYGEATSTYSSTGTQAVNGTAVASAIAGKADASDVYTKTEVDNKNYIRSLEINSSTNIDTLSLDSTNKESHYRWFGDKPSGTYTEIPSSEQINCRMIFRNITGSACLQELYPYESTDHYWVRTKKTSTWSAWKKVYYEAASTYSPTGTQAINGTGVKAALDNYVASPSNNRWIGCISTATIAGGEQYWPLVTFRADSNCWSLQFQISRSNRQFDDTHFETDNISISGYTKAESGTLKVGRIAFGPDGRGYAANFYHELTTTGSGSSIQYWHTIYIKTEWAANKFQWCKLDKVMGYATVSSIQWLSYDTAQTQPTNPLAATYFCPRVTSTAVGSSSVPVYANGSGAIVACTTADLKAGKDGSGNTITSTYATKTELGSKWYSQCNNLTASDDLDEVKGNASHTTSWYWWSGSSKPDNRPDGMNNEAMMCVYRPFNSEYVTQEIWSSVNGHYIRKCTDSKWSTWVKIYYSPRKSNDVASFTTDDDRAYSGKAIAEYVAGAIGGNVGGYMGECSKTDVASHTFKMGDWFVASEAGTYTYTVSGTSKTINNVVIGDELYFTTDNELEVKPTTAYEKTANKVTTLDNSTTHYPSTSAVKTYVDNGIANLSNTYETITNVANKNNLKIVEIGIPGSSYATADLNTLGDARNVSWWFWGSASATNISNRPDNNSQFLKIVKFTSSYCEQFCYPRGQSNFYWKRTNNNGVWDSAWVKSYYEATSTYSETGTQAVNGTAVASAIASGTAAKANQDVDGNPIKTTYAKQADMGATYIAETRTLRFDGLTFS